MMSVPLLAAAKVDLTSRRICPASPPLAPDKQPAAASLIATPGVPEAAAGHRLCLTSAGGSASLRPRPSAKPPSCPFPEKNQRLLILLKNL